MLTDRYGLAISTSSEAARDAYVAGSDGVLSAAHDDKTQLERAVALDADFALAHVALARARFLLADVAGAREAAGKARALASRATAREQSHINALCLAMEGNPVGSLEATRSHL